MIEEIKPPESQQAASDEDHSAPPGLEACYTAFKECQARLSQVEENESLETEINEEWEKALRAYEELKTGAAQRKEQIEKELEEIRDREREIVASEDPHGFARFKLRNIASDVYSTLENLEAVEGSLAGDKALMGYWYRGVQTDDSRQYCGEVDQWGKEQIGIISSAQERLEELSRG